MDTTAAVEVPVTQPKHHYYYSLTLDDGSQLVGRLADPQHGKAFQNVAGQNILCYRLTFCGSTPINVPARFLSWSDRQSMTWAPSPSDLAQLFLRAIELDTHRAQGHADDLGDEHRHDGSHQRAKQQADVSGSRSDVFKDDEAIIQPYGDGEDGDEVDENRTRAKPHSRRQAEPATETMETVQERGALAEVRQHSGAEGAKANVSQPHVVGYSRLVHGYGGGINDWIDGVEDGVELESTMSVVDLCSNLNVCRPPHHAENRVGASPGSSPTLFRRRQQPSDPLPSTSDSPPAVADISLPYPLPPPPPRPHGSRASPSRNPYPTPSTESGPATPDEIPDMPRQRSPSSSSHSHLHHRQLPLDRGGLMSSNSSLSAPQHDDQECQDQDQGRNQNRSSPVPFGPSSQAPDQHHLHHHNFASSHYQHLPSPPLFHLLSTQTLPPPAPSYFPRKRQADDMHEQMGESEPSRGASPRHEDVHCMHKQYRQSSLVAKDCSFAIDEDVWSGSAAGTAIDTRIVSTLEDEMRAVIDGSGKEGHEVEEEHHDRREMLESAVVVGRGVSVVPGLSPRTIPSTQHAFLGRSSKTPGASSGIGSSGTIDLLEKRCQSYLGVQNITIGTRHGSAHSRLATSPASVPRSTSSSLTKAKSTLDDWELEVVNSLLSVGSRA
ncbi:hypothetical protein DL93DRAFT_2102552 [Clavulina sp. PMI_390]|nr:hypothetical protein DL93DRAFT_2102552 [Clavulina sp. PMI_390]